MSNSTHPLVLATKFDVFFKIPGNLLPTSFQVTKFAGTCVKLDDDTRWFDWASFKSAIDNYNGHYLILNKFKNTTITVGKSTVETMVDKIVKFLVETLSVIVDPASIESLTSAIEATFTNLEEKSSKDFLDFTESSDGHTSSWEYRIQLAFSSPDLPEYFYSLVTTIKLEADIVEKSGWWDLTGSTSKNFSATINTMELLVMMGFRNPNA